MRRASELRKIILEAIDTKGLKQEALAQVIGKARQTLNKKLNGSVPFFYEEVVAIAEFFEMPDLAGKDLAQNPGWDPFLKDLIETLRSLPEKDREEFYRVSYMFLKGKPRGRRKGRHLRLLKTLQ